MSPRVYSSARDRILEAANRLVLEGGVSQLSVEAVAEAAQVSKGGFFHHFASKDELLVALLDKVVEDSQREIDARAAQDPEPRGARLRAQIALAFDLSDEMFEKLVMPLLALVQVAKSKPELIRRGKQINAASFARDEAEDIPLGRAIAIQFALDGYALNAGMAGGALTPRQKAAFRDSLMVLAQPEARPTRGARGARPNRGTRRNRRQP